MDRDPAKRDPLQLGIVFKFGGMSMTSVTRDASTRRGTSMDLSARHSNPEVQSKQISDLSHGPIFTTVLFYFFCCALYEIFNCICRVCHVKHFHSLIHRLLSAIRKVCRGSVPPVSPPRISPNPPFTTTESPPCSVGVEDDKASLCGATFNSCMDRQRLCRCHPGEAWRAAHRRRGIGTTPPVECGHIRVKFTQRLCDALSRSLGTRHMFWYGTTLA